MAGPPGRRRVFPGSSTTRAEGRGRAAAGRAAPAWAASPAEVAAAALDRDHQSCRPRRRGCGRLLTGTQGSARGAAAPAVSCSRIDVGRFPRSPREVGRGGGRARLGPHRRRRFSGGRWPRGHRGHGSRSWWGGDPALLERGAGPPGARPHGAKKTSSTPAPVGRRPRDQASSTNMLLGRHSSRWTIEAVAGGGRRFGGGSGRGRVEIIQASRRAPPTRATTSFRASSSTGGLRRRFRDPAHDEGSRRLRPPSPQEAGGAVAGWPRAARPRSTGWPWPAAWGEAGPQPRSPALIEEWAAFSLRTEGETAMTRNRLHRSGHMGAAHGRKNLVQKGFAVTAFDSNPEAGEKRPPPPA